MYTEEEKFKIWMSKPETFNTWRRENDLKNLCQYILTHSESFTRWLNSYNLSLQDILAITPSRNVFWGNANYRFIEYEDEQQNHYIKLISPSTNMSKETKIKRDIKYKPYFIWKEINEPDEIFLINNKKQQFKDISLRNSGSFSERTISKDNLEVNEVILLFGEVKILDIGNVRLASDFGLLNKNLDFMCLNNITLYDSSNLSYSQLDVCCSSIKNLHIKNTIVQFFRFYKCQCSRLKIENSIVSDLFIEESFMDDRLYGLYVDRSKVDKFTIKHVDIKNINIYDSELSNFKYIPEDLKGKMKFISRKYRLIFDNVKRIRLAFEAVGNSTEASQFYFWEKNLERKCFRYNFSIIAPKSKYGGSYWSIIKSFITRKYNFENSLKYFKWKSEFYIKLIFVKKYRQPVISLLFNQVRLYFEWGLWGYGERPFRIVLNSIFTILVFSALYYFSDNQNLSFQLINAFYYSVITFTTLGYGDITPHNEFLKMISSLEALMGALSLGLLIAGFTNKSRN